MKLSGDFRPSSQITIPNKASKADLWILSRASEAIAVTNQSMEKYNFSSATTAVYSFWLYDLCDNYLEMIKPVFAEGSGDKAAAQETLYTCLDIGLKLLHPFMPFVTEELYQRLPRRDNTTTSESIMISSYPTEEKTNGWKNVEVENEMKLVTDVVHGIRSIRSTYNVIPSKRPVVFVNAKTQQVQTALHSHASNIKSLSLAGDVQVQLNVQAPAGCAINVINESCDVFVDIKDLIDVAAEIQRMQGKRAQLATQRDNLLAKINQPQYEKNVPAAVKEEHAQKLANLEQEIAATTAAMDNFASLK